MWQILTKFETFECVALALACICGVLIYAYLRHHYDYWKRHGITQLEPSFLFGNVGEILRMQHSTAECIQDIYNHRNAVDKACVGIYLFHKPALLVRDPELVKRVLIKDFSKFADRYSNLGSKSDPLGSQNLFFLKNPTWKNVRFKLTPFFTSAKLNHMFNLVATVGRNLDTYLLNQPLENATDKSFILEMKEFCALYTTDVIATTAYGVEANSFQNPNGEFRRNGRKVFRFSTKRSFIFAVTFFLPRLAPYLSMNVLPAETTHFIRSTINYVMQQRILSGKLRNDLIDILIEFNKWSHSKHNDLGFVFEGDLLVAQAAIFFTAGFETSSATMSFALYELAKHADIQQRLRAEIRQALLDAKGVVTKQLIDGLVYMQMIIYEVLRLYPPLPFLDRECTVAEGETYSLEPFAEFKVPRGMPIYIPVYALHMDAKHYPNPTQFDPARFSAENRKLHTQGTYMPFGLGPHGCVGERLAMLQIKIGLLHFFHNHYVTPCARTKMPMKLDPKALIVQAEGGIHLRVVRDTLDVSITH